MVDAADGERFEEAAQLRDAMRTVQTLHDRQQKMATAELGDRDVFGAEARAGRRRRSRCSRCAAAASSSAIELGTDDADRRRAARATCSRRRIQQFYELRGAPPEIHVPAEPDEREALEAWLSERAGRRVRIVVPQRGEKRGLVELANRNAALAYQTRFNQTTAAQYDALETLQHVLGAAGAAAPHRVLRHLDDPGQRDRGVDGRLRGRPDAAGRVPEIPNPGRGCADAGARRSRTRTARASSPDARGPSPARLQDDFAAMHEVVQRRYRKLLEQGGPFPDLDR